jgi:hypothetical protein
MAFTEWNLFQIKRMNLTFYQLLSDDFLAQYREWIDWIMLIAR